MHKVSLTLNQDKRRRFDSYPGSKSAGHTSAVPERPADQDAECSHRCSLEDAGTQELLDELTRRGVLVWKDPEALRAYGPETCEHVIVTSGRTA